MKKIVVAMAIAFACLSASIAPVKANDGVIIHMKPTPTPTPKGDEGGRMASNDSTNSSTEIPSFWDFLAYFGL